MMPLNYFDELATSPSHYFFLGSTIFGTLLLPDRKNRSKPGRLSRFLMEARVVSQIEYGMYGTLVLQSVEKSSAKCNGGFPKHLLNSRPKTTTFPELPRYFHGSR
jgi:hypothetical protein|tara:strand:+ start:216 stop:530 length:315 start_codon:yes stop_codon:yes gene_type:complete